MQPPAEPGVQWHPPRLSVAGGAGQVDPPDGIGGAAEDTPALQYNSRLSHVSSPMAPFSLFNGPPLRDFTSMVVNINDLAVAIEVATVHPKLNAALRLNGGIGPRFEFRPAAECSRPQMNLVPAQLAILATTLVGALDEDIQTVLPSRVFDPVDMLFNLLAAVMAATASSALRWARRLALWRLGRRPTKSFRMNPTAATPIAY